ncbi:MAG: hypothetical protein LBC18_02545 [Opitutaceae bacterium]|jgi:hypothetical protein|nr:hypothetical protein [Opitutaceae bacterium]
MIHPIPTSLRQTAAITLAFRFLLAGLLLAQFESCLFAQAVPPAASTEATDAAAKPVSVPTESWSSAPPNGDEEKIVEMSPFTITADRSVGYAATQSLSCTRLNTEIKDIGSSITEMTIDFLKDINALSFQDAVSYAPGTTSYLYDINDRDGNRALGGTYYMVRGMGTYGMARDFFRTTIPLDTYNTERLSFARGANSVLYGIADPTGLVITSLAKPNLQRDRVTLSGDWSTYGVHRVTLDANTSAKHRLFRRDMPAGIRFVTFDEERPKFLKPDRHEQRRYYVAGAIQPWEGASVRLNYENVKLDQTGSRMYAPYDAISAWQAAGSNYVEAPGGAMPAGVVRLSDSTKRTVVVMGSDGEPQYAFSSLGMGRVAYAAAPTGVDTARFNGRVSLQDYSLYPANDVNFLGLNNSGQTLRGHASTIIFEQLIGRNFAFELGVADEKTSIYTVSPISSAYYLAVDVNKLLPNGEPNPYVGVPYFDYTRGATDAVATVKDYRATLTYNLDLRRGKGRLGKFLGRHRFAALAERYESTNSQDQLYEVNATPLPGFPSAITASSGGNYLSRRTYVGVGSSGYTADSTRQIRSFGTIAATPVDAGVVNSRMGIFSPLNSKTVTESALLAVQSFMADEHIVFTGGMRWDTQDLYNADTWRHPETNEFASWREMPLPGSPTQTDSGRTGTLGVVWHINRYFSLSWNKSENFQPPAGGIRTVFGTPLPASKGKTEDIGFKFRFREDRISGNITYFEAFRTNESDQGLRGSNAERIDAIWDAINPDMKVNDLTWRDTRDYRTQGYEFQITLNPTPALRISANLTQLKTEKSNILPFTRAYLEKHEGLWTSPENIDLATTYDVNGQSRTVGQVLQYIKNSNENNLRTAGELSQGLNEWMANLVGNYTFQSGVLKGFGAGVAQQWRSSPVLGYEYLPLVDAETGQTNYYPDIDHPLYGKDWWNTNIWFNYDRLIFKRKVRWQVKLSVSNLLDRRTYDTERGIDSATGENVMLRYRFITPRTFTISTSFQY